MSAAAEPSRAELRAGLDEALHEGLLLLDAGRHGAFLETTTAELRYRVVAYSPDLRREMTWLEHDRAGLAALIELLPRHHVDGAIWQRHAVLQTAVLEAPGRARAVSALALYSTVVDVGDAHVEGGSTHLLAVGRYHDVFREERGQWRLAEREVRLDTRQLGVGSHRFP
jgi:methanesulfonate monooxygenase small subunit